LVLEPSRKPGTERLVMDIARAFAERWRAVFWDTDAEVLDLADLRATNCQCVNYADRVKTLCGRIPARRKT
jgi:hypothetical protein